MGVGRVNALTALVADDPSGVPTVAPDSGASQRCPLAERVDARAIDNAV